jgi:hypothetical protein
VSQSAILFDAAPSFSTRESAVSPEALELHHAVTKVFVFPWDTATREQLRASLLAQFEDTINAALNDNWDGEGAKAVREEAIVEALALLALLSPTIPEPEITVDTDGGISFDWQRSRTQMYALSVTGQGVIYYAGIIGSDHTHGHTILGESLPIAVRAHLRRLFTDEHRWASA